MIPFRHCTRHFFTGNYEPHYIGNEKRIELQKILYSFELNEELHIFRKDDMYYDQKILDCYRLFLNNGSLVEKKQLFNYLNILFNHTIIKLHQRYFPEFINIFWGINNDINYPAAISVTHGDNLENDDINTEYVKDLYKEYNDKGLTKIEYASIIIQLPEKYINNQAVILKILKHELMHCLQCCKSQTIEYNTSIAWGLACYYAEQFDIIFKEPLSLYDLNQLIKTKSVIYNQFETGKLLSTLIYYCDYSERAAYLQSFYEELKKIKFTDVIQNGQQLSEYIYSQQNLYTIYKNLLIIVTILLKSNKKLTWTFNYKPRNFCDDYQKYIKVGSIQNDIKKVKVNEFRDILKIWYLSLKRQLKCMDDLIYDYFKKNS